MTASRPLLSRPLRGSLPFALCLTVLAGPAGCSVESPAPVAEGPAVEQGYDPVVSDPAGFDPEYPPAMAELAIPSGDALMNAILYVAPGAGPHPTVVLLHGFPGNEKNLDLAQAIRRAGWSVLFFHYRGSWGSGGTYSFGNVLDDVDAALDFLAVPELGSEHRVDPARVVLVGHSLGGFAALMTAARREDVDGVVSLAGANLGLYGARAAEEPEMRQAFVAALEADTGPLAGTSGEALVQEVLAAGDDWDLRNRVERITDRPVLLIAASRDEGVDPDQHHRPLVAAFQDAGAERLDHMILRGDHSFSPSRIALAQAVVGWLSREFDGDPEADGDTSDG